MELNLKVPKGLEDRLRANETRLVEILELGLAALEDRPPAPEELLAYSRRELAEDARDVLTERLALDPDAVDDLLDLEHFEELSPPSEAHRLSDDDVRRALGALRAQVDESSPAPIDRAAPRQGGGAASGPEPSHPGPNRPAESRRSHWGAPTWLAMAAGLLLAFGLWSWDSPSESSAAHVFEAPVRATRESTPEVQIPEAAKRVSLSFAVPSIENSRALLRIVRDDKILAEEELELTAEGHNAVQIYVEGRLLEPGIHTMQLVDVDSKRPVENTQRFLVKRPTKN